MNTVISKQNGLDALEYLKSESVGSATHPDLIFLDINMPRMNGWEFLEEYDKLDKRFQSRTVVVMLTTSENPDEEMKARLFGSVSEFKTKPVTKGMLEEIMDKYFPL